MSRAPEPGGGDAGRRGAGALALYEAGNGSGTLALFAQTIGEEATLRLSMHFGGRQLHIPRTPRRDSELVKVVGQVAAQALGKRFGSGNYMVPLEAGKRARIVWLRSQKTKVADVAEMVGCTERYVWKVCQEYRKAGGTLEVSFSGSLEDPNQLALFGAEE